MYIKTKDIIVTTRTYSDEAMMIIRVKDIYKKYEKKHVHNV